MRIGIDYTAAVNQRAGIGRYTRCLVTALAELDDQNEYVLFYSYGGKDNVGPFFADRPNFHERRLRISARNLAIIWYRLRLPIHVERATGALSLFHSPDYNLPPLRCGRGIVTVHDLSFLLFPECHDKSLREYLEKTVPWSVSRATLVLADSMNTMNDLVCLLDARPERVRVVYPGVDERFRRVEDAATLQAARDKFGLHFPFILYVGTIEPRKNLGRLIQAYARLKARRQLEHKLVIAGQKGWLYDDVFRRAVDLRVEEDVVFPGYVSDDDLPSLYSLADAFVFPSLYEGFGLPPLEAMACGTPVVTSTASSLPEVAGDAALLVSPTDVDELAQAIARVLDDSDLRRRLSAKGVERAGALTWRSAAKSLLEIYESLEKVD